MATFKSCYHCKERYLGCHSICPKYLKEKAKWEEDKKLIKVNKTVVLTNYDFNEIAYANSKRHKQRSR
jgi:hypothetical protein